VCVCVCVNATQCGDLWTARQERSGVLHPLPRGSRLANPAGLGFSRFRVSGLVLHPLQGRVSLSVSLSVSLARALARSLSVSRSFSVSVLM
jgi:hypothetical protein